MGVSDILSVVQTASLVLGICVAVGTIRGRNQGSAATLAEMRKDIEYIKDKVKPLDDMTTNTAVITGRVDRLEGRVSDLEQKIDRR